jgi:hypothetical protein
METKESPRKGQLVPLTSEMYQETEGGVKVLFIRNQALNNIRLIGMNEEEAAKKAEEEWNKLSEFVDSRADENQKELKTTFANQILGGSNFQETSEFIDALIKNKDTKSLGEIFSNISSGVKEDDYSIFDDVSVEELTEEFTEQEKADLSNALEEYLDLAEEIGSFWEDKEKGISEEEMTQISDSVDRFRAIAVRILKYSPETLNRNINLFQDLYRVYVSINKISKDFGFDKIPEMFSATQVREDGAGFMFGGTRNSEIKLQDEEGDENRTKRLEVTEVETKKEEEGFGIMGQQPKETLPKKQRGTRPIKPAIQKAQKTMRSRFEEAGLLDKYLEKRKKRHEIGNKPEHIAKLEVATKSEKKRIRDPFSNQFKKIMYKLIDLSKEKFSEQETINVINHYKSEIQILISSFGMRLWQSWLPDEEIYIMLKERVNYSVRELAKVFNSIENNPNQIAVNMIEKYKSEIPRQFADISKPPEHLIKLRKEDALKKVDLSKRRVAGLADAFLKLALM